MSEQENKPQTTKSGRLVKITLGVFLILIIILTGIVSMNLDSLRESVMEEFSQMTGLSIEIESLNLSLSNGLSFRGGGLKVNLENNSNQILSAKEIFLNAELRPLLKRQLKIKKIILIKPAIEIALESKPDVTTFSDISKTKKPSDQKNLVELDEANNLALPKIQKSDKNFIGSIREVLKNKNFSLRTVEMKDAKLTLLGPKNNSPPTKEFYFFLDGQFKLSNPNADKFHVDGKLFNLETEGLNFSGTFKAEDLLGEYIPLKLELQTNPLPITKVDILRSTLANVDLAPVILESGQIESMFINLQGPINPRHDPFKEIIVTSGFETSDLEVSINKNGKNERVTLPYLKGEGVWQKNTLNYEINGVLWGGSIQSNFVINLPNPLNGSRMGTINSETKLHGLKLASVELSLPHEWEPITGTAKGTFKFQGPIGKSSPSLRKSGQIYINDLKLGLKTPISFGSIALNLQQKSSQQSLARIHIKDALLDNIFIKKAGAKIKLFPERVLLTQGHLVPSNGVIHFSGDYHSQLKTYIVRIDGTDVRIEDLLTNRIEGTGFFKGMFQGNLNQAKNAHQKGETVLFSHIASSLSGRLNIELKNGSISTSSAIGEISSLFQAESIVDMQKNLYFDTLGADLKLWQGKVVTENLQFKGPQIDLAALMAANLVTGEIDGEVKVIPMQLLDNIIKSIPLLGSILSEDVTNVTAETYFRLGGTFKKPKLILEENKTLFGQPLSILKNLIKIPN